MRCRCSASGWRGCPASSPGRPGTRSCCSPCWIPCTCSIYKAVESSGRSKVKWEKKVVNIIKDTSWYYNLWSRLLIKTLLVFVEILLVHSVLYDSPYGNQKKDENHTWSSIPGAGYKVVISLLVTITLVLVKYEQRCNEQRLGFVHLLSKYHADGNEKPVSVYVWECTLPSTKTTCSVSLSILFDGVEGKGGWPFCTWNQPDIAKHTVQWFLHPACCEAGMVWPCIQKTRTSLVLWILYFFVALYPVHLHALRALIWYSRVKTRLIKINNRNGKETIFLPGRSQWIYPF